MKSFTVNTTQSEFLSAEELGRKIKSIYKTVWGRFGVEGSETPYLSEYREENLLDENMGPEIRRMRW